MMTQHPTHSRKMAAGFTLIELLVVIGIIGILAAIMFPAANGAMRRAAAAHAENTCYQMKNAISAYFTEYRKYPVAPGTSEETVFRTDNTLMDVLLGGDSEARQGGLNPRRIVFYTDKQARPTGDGGSYARGVVLQSDGGGELWDPFGEYYYVVMDLDYNNRVNKPSWDTTSESSVLPEAILVWSSGPSGDENTPDNIKTW